MPAVLRHLNMGEKINTEAIATTGTAEQLAKKPTTLIPGRLLCDATIKSYRVNKCTQVAGHSMHHRHLNMGEK